MCLLNTNMSTVQVTIFQTCQKGRMKRKNSLKCTIINNYSLWKFVNLSAHSTECSLTEPENWTMPMKTEPCQCTEHLHLLVRYSSRPINWVDSRMQSVSAGVTVRPARWHLFTSSATWMRGQQRNISCDISIKNLCCSGFIYVVSVFYTSEYCLPLVTMVTWNFFTFLGTFSNLHCNWIGSLNTRKKPSCTK